MAFSVKAWLWSSLEENRRLTLKVARAFPDEALMAATPVAGMRPFAEMLLEVVGGEHFLIQGLAEDRWDWSPRYAWNPAHRDASPPKGPAELLDRMQEVRAYARAMWDRIPEERLLTVHPRVPGYGADAGLPLYWLLGTVLENEVHHRAQGYVYLRLLGLEPPFFWDRA